MLVQALKCKAPIIFCSFHSSLSPGGWAQSNSASTRRRVNEKIPPSRIIKKPVSFALCKLQFAPVRAPLEKIVIARENKRNPGSADAASARKLFTQKCKRSVQQTKPQGAPLDVLCVRRGRNNPERSQAKLPNIFVPHCRFSAHTLHACLRGAEDESGVKMQKRKMKRTRNKAGNTLTKNCIHGWCPDDLE